jgi:hypothetical protein
MINTGNFSNFKTNSYEGQYANDKKHGYGIFEWESGNVYNGKYVDDERHGYGVMRWTDGSTYLGTWESGIQQGIGVMIFSDGSRKAGLFDQNVFVRSVRTLEDIAPYRDKLEQECIYELERIVRDREDRLRERQQSMKKISKERLAAALEE